MRALGNVSWLFIFAAVAVAIYIPKAIHHLYWAIRDGERGYIVRYSLQLTGLILLFIAIVVGWLAFGAFVARNLNG